MYNLFREFPAKLTVYNLGQVSSIAAVAFIGAQKRKASAHASFMFHRSANAVGQPATASRLKLLAESVGLDDVLRQHLKLTDAQWRVHERDDLIFSAKDALAAGIVDEIAEFTPPIGQKLFTV